MKYIRFRNRGFVLFENDQSHREVADMVGDEVVSAGFVRSPPGLDEGHVSCGGESESLRKASAPGDSDALLRRLNQL